MYEDLGLERKVCESLVDEGKFMMVLVWQKMFLRALVKRDSCEKGVTVKREMLEVG